MGQEILIVLQLWGKKFSPAGKSKYSSIVLELSFWHFSNAYCG